MHSPGSPHPRRPRAIRIGVAVGSGLAVLTSSVLPGALGSPVNADEPVNPRPTQSADARGPFGNPSMSNRPLYRFWNTGGLATRESIARQVQQVKASGAGGFETNQLTKVVETAAGYDAETMSWGTPSWLAAQLGWFEEGRKAGLRVDTIYTPGWSAGTQDLSTDKAGSAKEISFGSAWLNAGESYNGEVPKSALPDGVSKRVLQGVLAYRCESNCTGTGADIPVLDPGSVVNLTTEVENGAVSWTAPDASGSGAARYVIVGAWMHGTGQHVDLAATPEPTILADHFGRAGFKAIRDYTENKAMTPKLRAAMRRSGGSLFFDSLELNRSGAQVLSWTPKFLEAFERRQGYSFIPFLPAAAVTTPVFDFSGGIGERIREDYNQTLSDLFRDNHLLPLKRYAASYNMTVRGQAYSSYGPAPVDISDMAAILDTPEGEDLSFNEGFDFAGGQVGYLTLDGSDSWRTLASAGAQAGHKVVSTECCAMLGNNHVSRQKLLTHVNQQFSVGVNQIVWHGWADQSPGAANQWPGFSPFGGFISDVYGPQIPMFADDKAVNTYVGRVQTILRRGQLRNDVAIYRDDNNHTPSGSTGELYFADQSLARAGYTYGFLNDTLLQQASVDGGRLEAATLGYKALVLDNTDTPATNPTMTLMAARRVLAFARHGLPVVVVGDLPTRVRGNHPEQDAALRNVNSKLLATAGVRQVADQAAVLGALRSDGITSAARFTEPSPFVALHRQTSNSDYYHLFNSSTEATTTAVTMRGDGVPFEYNAWTGQVIPVAEFTRTRGGVRFPVTLASGDNALYGVTRGNVDTSMKPRLSAGSSTADEVVHTSKGKLAVRDTEAGRYTTELSNGDTRMTKIRTVPASTTPASWTLDVTSWEAGDGPNDTDKHKLPTIPLAALPNGKLPDWLTIPGLQNKSGIGVYSTTIDVGEAWTGGTGAYLDLGEIRGLARVIVNGKKLPPLNQVDPNHVDLRGYLVPGENTVVVRLSTPLGNAAYPTTPFGEKSYGLLGPVVLTPYGQRPVR
jgi:alpha-L-rhamnosidase